jgi:hypothetical protein
MAPAAPVGHPTDHEHRCPKSKSLAAEHAFRVGKNIEPHVPILSMDLTRERPLSCPGGCAFWDTHLGGVTLSVRRGLCGDALVDSVLQ